MQYTGVQDDHSKSQNVHAGSQDLQMDVMSRLIATVYSSTQLL